MKIGFIGGGGKAEARVNWMLGQGGAAGPGIFWSGHKGKTCGRHPGSQWV